MSTITMPMYRTKETKGTVVYRDVDESPAVPTLYIRKEHLPTPPPETVTLTISYDE